MNKVLKSILKVIEFIIIFYVIILSTVLLCKNKYGYTQIEDKTYVALGDRDTKDIKGFDKSSLLVFEKIYTEDVKVGDEVYYYSVEHERYTIKSGSVESIKGEDSNALFKIKDASAVSYDKVLGQQTKEYKNLGKVITFLSSRIGFLIFVLLPILVLFIYEIYDLVVNLKYEEVEVPTKAKNSKKSK